MSKNFKDLDDMDYSRSRSTITKLTKKMKAEDIIENINESKTMSVKNSLFSSFDEKEMVPFQDETEGIYSKPLSEIFGFFESTCVVKTYDRYLFTIHLKSDKPFSYTEINVLKERLSISFGRMYQVFFIYQDPDDTVESVDDWINLRNEFDDVSDSSGKNVGGIYRKAGLVSAFKSLNYGTKLPISFSQTMTHAKSDKKNTPIDRMNLAFNEYLKKIPRRYQKAKIADYHKSEDGKIHITVVTDDERLVDDIISEDALNKVMIEQMIKQKLSDSDDRNLFEFKWSKKIS